MIRVLHGDCREVLAGMSGDCMDAVIADPPYAETNLEWDKWPPGWPTVVRRVLKRTGSMWVFGSARMFMEHASEFRGWRLSHDVVWEKHNGSGFFADRFRRVHEIAAHFYRDDAAWSEVFKAPQFTNDAVARKVTKKAKPAGWHGAAGATTYESKDGGPRLARSVMFVRSEHRRALHPTQKPIGIVQPLLAYACPPGGTVLDPFAGSGTTGICARLSGQSAVLIEANADFFSLMNRRLAEDAPLLAGAA